MKSALTRKQMKAASDAARREVYNTPARPMFVSEEFTITKATPPARNLPRNPKSELLIQMEGLKVGEVLQWRPKGEHSPKAAYSRAVQVRRSHGYTITVRKVNLG